MTYRQHPHMGFVRYREADQGIDIQIGGEWMELAAVAERTGGKPDYLRKRIDRVIWDGVTMAQLTAPKFRIPSPATLMLGNARRIEPRPGIAIERRNGCARFSVEHRGRMRTSGWLAKHYGVDGREVASIIRHVLAADGRASDVIAELEPTSEPLGFSCPFWRAALCEPWLP